MIESSLLTLEKVVGENGDHSARLKRVVEDVPSFLSDTKRGGSAEILISRIGTFVGPLAADIANGSVDRRAAAALLVVLRDLGDLVFRRWLDEDALHVNRDIGSDGPQHLDGLRRSLSVPIPAVFEAARRLQRAVEAHFSGDRNFAERELIIANDPRVREYTNSGWGAGSAKRYAFLQLNDAPPYFPKELRPKPRMPSTSVRIEVLARDGYHCRFCGTPVISPAVRKRFQMAYPHAVLWGTTNASQHAAFQCMWLQFDHLLPNSRGGDSSAQNVVITCAVCNFGRMQATLEEARLINPLDHETPREWPGFVEWNGLSNFR